VTSLSPASEEPRSSAAEVVAGYLAAAAMLFAFMSALNIDLTIDGVDFAFRPIRVGVAAAIASLVAAGMSRGSSRLPMISVYFCAVCWFVGMVVAVVTGRPLY
jgi:hypothetical protein